MQVDNDFLSLEEALAGVEIAPSIRETLTLVDVRHLSFDGNTHKGQLVVHKDLAEDVRRIFKELIACKFPVQKVVPIVAYNWNDEASMQDNNTSGFNYRRIIATNRLSNHSYGHAIDINPKQNPYYALDGRVHPQGATYDPTMPGTLTKDSDAVKIFKEYGWIWYGERAENKDYQHFQKLL